MIVYVVHVSKKAQEVFIGIGLLSEHQSINFGDLHVDENVDLLFKSYDISTAISNFSKRDPVKTVSPSQPLSSLIQLLSTYHRVAVVDGDNLVDYITQSDLIKFIYNNKQLLGDLTSKSLSELNLASKGVETVKDYNLVIEAFKQVAIKGISAVAVVDKDGHLVGDIGAHDMREINPEGDMVDKLIMTTKNYLDHVKSRKPVPPHTVKSSESLGTLVSLLETNKIHRVYVVDDQNKPVGVVSLGDVLGCVLKL
eukprot:TRINITY_DN893_c0_g1_i1.p1 TRINITY_DN893_c0_g1~~TRINITY_DN893_c0_g1_i1.p1  ORF type:complete len:253 (+),score=88.11 TRINITY_DN893_c0_g1_i1:1956-2714(+)